MHAERRQRLDTPADHAAAWINLALLSAEFGDGATSDPDLSAICVAVFKIFRIPVNKWTLPTAVLGGIFLISAILLIMNYNHPFTKNARIYFATTPIGSSR